MMEKPRSFSAVQFIALYEVGKGILALLTAAVIWYDRDKLSLLAQVLTEGLHHFFGRFLVYQIDKLYALSQTAIHNVYAVITMLVIYALIRFGEGYGLYRERTWGYWFSFIAYGLFIPVELYEVVKRFNFVHCMVFVVNIAIMVVIYKRMKKQGLL
ncbi:DUF2127 domain-containing protein [Neisseria sp. S1]|uniref:DUF2127 domain-containing protein n=1 Tax=Neisseria sp. S1 TaxID=3318354 RepID=UPI003A878D82